MKARVEILAGRYAGREGVELFRIRFADICERVRIAVRSRRGFVGFVWADAEDVRPIRPGAGRKVAAKVA